MLRHTYTCMFRRTHAILTDTYTYILTNTYTCILTNTYTYILRHTYTVIFKRTHAYSQTQTHDTQKHIYITMHTVASPSPLQQVMSPVPNPGFHNTPYRTPEASQQIYNDDFSRRSSAAPSRSEPGMPHLSLCV